ncbi:hypothetical protein GobsT_53200 [Gemmata obscuriglobus]|uniref:Uncharacterized protein n=1 Tax=Gemmata obscuriglobus TaxID=114 RepID=A0A2Z3GZS2_9BACT|nr:hypothetical protein [Gemmata obscuriglobus]AWM36816.1 hypothetical protein C1280_07165 [Gemmata obscuriglobus]QEG30515.1 hypothetical protein GobsT_53200 [Gemmata obscuriglobus]VTS09839.1 unnamed protein product [Gemmata obscuriglobus UQM 2246]
MHPVLRRVLLHGGLTALILAVMGAMLAELATLWLSGHATRSADPVAEQQVGTALRTRVPLMLAAWGFAFVLVGELVIWRIRGSRPAAPKPSENPQNDAEKLLNELLAQAESRMAAEAGGPEAGGEKPGEERPPAPPSP